MNFSIPLFFFIGNVRKKTERRCQSCRIIIIMFDGIRTANQMLQTKKKHSIDATRK